MWFGHMSTSKNKSKLNSYSTLSTNKKNKKKEEKKNLIINETDTYRY